MATDIGETPGAKRADLARSADLEDPSAVPHGAPAGPLTGPPGDDRYYAARIHQLIRLDLDEDAARALWNAVDVHRQLLARALGRDVGQRVALLDYVENVQRHVHEPRIIERADLESLEHQALVDPLTGLFNRRHFDAALIREIERCRRYGARSTLLVLDLDRFKQINDRCGHLTGDAVLRIVGRTIRRHLRRADVPCRYGGDEFAVLLVDTAERAAVAVARRIAHDVRAARFGVARAGLRVTLSCGLAELREGGGGGDAIVTAADTALYAAKRTGGDCVRRAGRRAGRNG